LGKCHGTRQQKKVGNGTERKRKGGPRKRPLANRLHHVSQKREGKGRKERIKHKWIYSNAGGKKEGDPSTTDDLKSIFDQKVRTVGK